MYIVLYNVSLHKSNTDSNQQVTGKNAHYTTCTIKQIIHSIHQPDPIQPIFESLTSVANLVIFALCPRPELFVILQCVVNNCLHSTCRNVNICFELKNFKTKTTWQKNKIFSSTKQIRAMSIYLFFVGAKDCGCGGRNNHWASNSSIAHRIERAIPSFCWRLENN